MVSHGGQNVDDKQSCAAAWWPHRLSGVWLTSVSGTHCGVKGTVTFYGMFLLCFAISQGLTLSNLQICVYFIMEIQLSHLNFWTQVKGLSTLQNLKVDVHKYSVVYLLHFKIKKCNLQQSSVDGCLNFIIWCRNMHCTVQVWWEWRGKIGALTHRCTQAPSVCAQFPETCRVLNF